MQLKAARFGLRDLRAEATSVAPALSLHAARLEHLDAAPTAGETEALNARPLGAGQRAYGLALRAALAGDPTPDRAALEAWLAEDSWIPATFADAVRMVRAVIRHERRRPEALVEACCGPPLPARGRKKIQWGLNWAQVQRIADLDQGQKSPTPR